ncbi:hypothetical protein BG011_009141 [Mortierella polycephala]|uniref:Uncharacterized protein n=1 Tax=Mortierella polycephala TaxID=41804 RepID=A0A9P6UB50_9FUNG|nr:hypothetical protein BG011_009141 [Mortierella polycephala]
MSPTTQASNATAKAIIYTSAGLQAIIALIGLLSAATKSVKITKAFSYLWWGITLVVLAMSIGSVYLVAKKNRDAVEDECRTSLKPSNGIMVTDDEVYNCYRTAVVISAVVLGVQFILMCLVGWIIQRFLREVKQDAAIDAAVKAVDDGEVHPIPFNDYQTPDDFKLQRIQYGLASVDY